MPHVIDLGSLATFCVHGRQKAICGECFPMSIPARTPQKTSDMLVSYVGEIQEVRRRLLGTTISDVPGRTADVKEVALLRLQQAADALAEEAMALERYGE